MTGAVTFPLVFGRSYTLSYMPFSVFVYDVLSDIHARELFQSACSTIRAVGLSRSYMAERNRQHRMRFPELTVMLDLEC